ncbi:MAG: hypothetical protein HYV28_16430, partial [Ignavibacteriales bacterium]|nr:hypothetical protein [Ignavibacteriales bacterium]
MKQLKQPPVINPANILAAQKKREYLGNLSKAIFVDSFFVFYAILVVQRIIFYRYIFEMKEVAFSWANIGLIAGISLLTGTLWSLSKTSIGSKLFSISKNTPLTKYT